MKKYKYILVLFVASAFITSCENMLGPKKNDHSSFKRVYSDPYFAEGLLLKAYNLLPHGSYKFDAVATDNAVSNDVNNSYRKMATGSWSALNNPENLWTNSNRAIMYLNRFLTVVDTVKWSRTNPKENNLFKRKLAGEAYALRGIFKFYLLRNHGGYGSSGNLLGFPIHNKFITKNSEFEKKRDSFSDCVQDTYHDLDTSLTLLPIRYGKASELPSGFKNISDIDNYNTVFGNDARQRVDGLIVEAFKTRLALLVASPAFNSNDKKPLWANAANNAAKVLFFIGGISGLDPKGDLFYLKNQVINTDLFGGNGKNIKEIIWRTPLSSNHTLEENNFPPSLFGNGRVDPTQNIVDAFPMTNGYPISNPKSGYDPNNPYKGRDPLLSKYILYNGGKLRDKTIHTGVGSGDDGLNSKSNSTRTGYYLKKLLRNDVNVNPISTNNQRHYVARIRFTEMFLDYAEAANEAWGPDGTGNHTYSARDVIAAIRKREGIEQPDNYLESINTKEKMRELIHNVRRIELCFEGFRFWDIRRWKLDLTKPAMGVRIENNSYTYFKVEGRNYNNNYMHYGPIPNDEVVREHLAQNKGW